MISHTRSRAVASTRSCTWWSRADESIVASSAGFSGDAGQRTSACWTCGATREAGGGQARRLQRGGREAAQSLQQRCIPWDRGSVSSPRFPMCSPNSSGCKTRGPGPPPQTTWAARVGRPRQGAAPKRTCGGTAACRPHGQAHRRARERSRPHCSLFLSDSQCRLYVYVVILQYLTERSSCFTPTSIRIRSDDRSET